MPNFRFNLPTLTQLTPAQQIALMSNEPILITGGPGSGKTVVSVRRLLRLANSNKSVKLFTFNRTLMAAIRGLAISENFDVKMIDSFYDWYYRNTKGIFKNDSSELIGQRFASYCTRHGGKFDEILLDESQDFTAEIIGELGHLGLKISCGADRDQDIRGIYNNDAEIKIKSLLSAFQRTSDHLLSQNFRNTREIFAFARQFVPMNPRPFGVSLNTLPTGEKPVVFGLLDEHDQMARLAEIVSLNQNSANIGILVHYRKQVDSIRTSLSSKGISHSYYYNGMSEIDRENTEINLQTPLITTFDSCKGLEFDIVIKPFFESADWALNNNIVTQNHYYVAATRARKQLFLFHNAKPHILSNFDNSLYRTDSNEDLFDF